MGVIGTTIYNTVVSHSRKTLTLKPEIKRLEKT